MSTCALRIGDDSPFTFKERDIVVGFSGWGMLERERFLIVHRM